MTDVRDKKITARSAFHKRTHTGKGGPVRFPSDYLSRKELNAMNSEVKYYNINNPMKWEDFKKMPDDIKAAYIKSLREKFSAYDTMIFEMLGIKQQIGSFELRRLGLGVGRSGRKPKPDKDAWFKWLHGVKTEKSEEPDAITDDTEPESSEIVVPGAAFVSNNPCVITEKEPVKALAVPESGQLNFECNASMALQMVGQILQDECVRITVAWQRIESGVGNE